MAGKLTSRPGTHKPQPLTQPAQALGPVEAAEPATDTGNAAGAARDESSDDALIVARLNPAARRLMADESFAKLPAAARARLVRAWRVDEASEFLRFLADVLEQRGPVPPSDAAVRRAVECIELARAHFAGWDARDASTTRIATSIGQLDWARSMLAPTEANAQMSPAAAAWSIASTLQRADPLGLGQVPAEEWERAVIAWKGYCRRQRGRRRTDYDWADVVFRLLKPCALVGARTSRVMADAFERGRRRE